MFRGAIILGIGFSLGYVKGLHDSKEVAEKLTEFVDAFKETKKAPDKAETTETPTEDILGTAIQSEPTTEGE